MSTKSQLTGTFHRRPSFWKTPITRNSPSLTGVKRSYSQINAEQNGNCNPQHDRDSNQHHNKKRRLLNKSEIADMAKCGGLQASNIILAVQETDGFCWFKRKTSMNAKFNKDKYLQKYWNIHGKPTATVTATVHPSNNDTSTTTHSRPTVLRELSKDELTKRATDKATQSQSKSKPKPKASNLKNETNPNLRNKEALQNAVKSRRHTVPTHVLSKLVTESHAKAKEKKPKHKHKKKPKRRKKTKKRVVKYKTTQEVIRKKVKKMKRIVYKKKTRLRTIKITTQYASIAIPNFPVPTIGLSVLFVSERCKPYHAIQQFELSLMESFVMPLTNVYGNHLSFVTRNVLQLLMELRKSIESVVQCMDHEVVSIPIKRSIVWYKEMTDNAKHNNNNNAQSKSITPLETRDKERSIETAQRRNMSIEREENEQLEDEYRFYEAHWKVLNEFVEAMEEEIEFTQCVEKDMASAEYLERVFDFDADLNSNVNDGCEAMVNACDDERFIENIAADIDAIYSEYCMDLFEIEAAQTKYDEELKQMELAYLQVVNGGLQQNTKDKDMEHCMDELIENEKERKVTLRSIGVVDAQEDKMIFTNFFKANQYNDYKEDCNGLETSNYLRQLNGYQMNGDGDTINLMNIDTH